MRKKKTIFIGIIFLVLFFLVGCVADPVQEQKICDIWNKYNFTNEDPDARDLANLMRITVKQGFCESGECNLKYMEEFEEVSSNVSNRTLMAYIETIECGMKK